MDRLIRLVFAFVLPPVSVFLKVGFADPFWINVILTLLGHIPGVAHALFELFYEPE